MTGQLGPNGLKNWMVGMRGNVREALHLWGLQVALCKLSSATVFPLQDIPSDDVPRAQSGKSV